jgi:hypothetical protein
MDRPASTACAARTRVRREPERGALHRLLREHLATFLARTSETDGPGLPRFVVRELRRYLACGILAHGFARVRCSQCGKDELVAFSCTGRGFCPSCGRRRMAETAAHLVDLVVPDVRVRQWVLSPPIRFVLAFDPALCTAVRRIVVRAILESLEQRAARAGTPGGRSGAVVLAQRFGGALNPNLHFHALVLDGVYTSTGLFTSPRFHPAPPLTDGEVVRLIAMITDGSIVRRILEHLELPSAPPEMESARSPPELEFAW